MDHYKFNYYFKKWWISKCEEPIITLREDSIIYIKNKFIKILDIIPPSRSLIYPSYENVIIGSGKELDLKGDIKNDEVYYVGHDDLFEVVGDIKIYYIKNNAKNQLIHVVKSTILRKLKVVRSPTRFTRTVNLMGNVFADYLEEILENNAIQTNKKGYIIKWSMTRSQINNILLREICEVSRENTKIYINPASFSYNLKRNTLSISGIILFERKDEDDGEVIIDGLDL